MNHPKMKMEERREGGTEGRGVQNDSRDSQGRGERHERDYRLIDKGCHGTELVIVVGRYVSKLPSPLLHTIIP